MDFILKLKKDGASQDIYNKTKVSGIKAWFTHIHYLASCLMNQKYSPIPAIMLGKLFLPMFKFWPLISTSVSSRVASLTQGTGHPFPMPNCLVGVGNPS